MVGTCRSPPVLTKEKARERTTPLAGSRYTRRYRDGLPVRPPPGRQPSNAARWPLRGWKSAATSVQPGSVVLTSRPSSKASVLATSSTRTPTASRTWNVGTATERPSGLSETWPTDSPESEGGVFQRRTRVPSASRTTMSPCSPVAGQGREV